MIIQSDTYITEEIKYNKHKGNVNSTVYNDLWYIRTQAFSVDISGGGVYKDALTLLYHKHLFMTSMLEY